MDPEIAGLLAAGLAGGRVAEGPVAAGCLPPPPDEDRANAVAEAAMITAAASIPRRARARPRAPRGGGESARCDEAAAAARADGAGCRGPDPGDPSGRPPGPGIAGPGRWAARRQPQARL